MARPYTDVSVNLVASVRKRLKALVIAWAQDSRTGQPRYILELRKEERGKRCGCVCIGCGQAVLAVKAATEEWQVRPHFRHVEGPDHPSCLVQSARAALLSSLSEGDLIVLPRQRRSISVAGLSGEIYEAWMESPPQPVHIRDVRFEDQLSAVVVLDDGRRLKVLVTGSTRTAQDVAGGVIPTIVIAVDSPDLAGMSPDELRSRLVPLIEKGSWCGHWPDPEGDARLLEQAKARAADALDLDDENTSLPLDLRRESLLHREVKAILESANSIHVPGWFIEIPDAWGEPLACAEISKRLTIRDAILEHRLGHIIPDVIVRLTDNTELLIEVTVTNKMTDERRERIRQVNLPALEIDFSRMGGVVNREQLRHLLLDELTGKSWLHHPEMEKQRRKLQWEAQSGEEGREKSQELREAIRSVPPEEWGQRYISAIRRHAELRWNGDVQAADRQREAAEAALVEIERAADALNLLGYPAALDQRLYDFGHTLLERLLSIRFDTGVGYRFDNAWQVVNTMNNDFTDEAKSWHSLYLMAIHTYRPRITAAQSKKVDDWRARVIASIKAGEQTYLRDARYDDLLALLFPEMADGLQRPFGKREPVTRTSPPTSLQHVFRMSASIFDDYDLDRWIWATTSSERVRLAALEASKARLNGIVVEPGNLLYEMAHSQHASAPSLHAGGLTKTTGLSRAEILRYLYRQGYIKLANPAS